jgi:hypothetical protein
MRINEGLTTLCLASPPMAAFDDPFSDSAARRLSDALRVNKTLTHLELSSYALTSHSFEDFCEVLLVCLLSFSA